MATAKQTTKQQAAEIGAALPEDHRSPADVTLTIEFRGKTFNVETANWTFRVQRLLERGLVAEAVERLIGEEQFEEFMDFPLSVHSEFMVTLGKARQAAA